MADPPPFFVTSLSGQNTNPIVPDEFFSGKNEFMKLKLTSDAFDRTWEVKLNGRRFAGGWEDFSAAHCLRDDDVLVFRHDGDMFFHVTPSGRSFSFKKQQCASSFEEEDDDDDEEDSQDDDDEEDSQDDDDDDDEEDSKDDDDDDDEEDSEEDDDDVGDKEEDETWEDDSDSMNKKKSRLKAESSSSSENSCFLAVTPSSLRKNQVTVSRPFSRSNGLNKRYCEIDLMNESGKSWVLGLRHNKSSGQDYIFGDWRSFCRANELNSGFSYRFNLVWNGTRPLLQLCSDIAPERNCSKPNARANVSAKSSSEEMKNFLTVTFKPYMLKSRQLRIPRHFARQNGIKEGEIITLVDQNGKKWQSYLASAREQSNFYMTKSWIRFCAANRLKIGETFTLKFVRGEDTTPMLKFCSNAKVEMEQVPLDEEEDCQEETENRVQKRARVSTEGGPSRCTRASNKSSVDPKNLQCKQPLQLCSFSDQLTKVKQSIVDTLTSVRRFRSELEIKEQNLEASLQAIDALGEKVLEINKILK